ncbi:MAG TPA: DUF4268 domain-containing protein [Mariniphaga sp.]|nr:DUF4268 domain-containing protein [Mariniphaga sp.]
MYTQEELKQLRLNFWEQFGRRCKVHPELRLRKKNFILHRTKIPGVALRFEVDRNAARVILELGQKNEDKRLMAFEILQRYKILIEQGFPEGLIWEFYHQREDSLKEVCRIYTQLENVDIHRQNQWPDIYNFFIDNMLQLEENFLMVRDVFKEELEA